MLKDYCIRKGLKVFCWILENSRNFHGFPVNPQSEISTGQQQKSKIHTDH